MSYVKLCDLEEVPADGEGKLIHFEHPLTDLKYDLALFKNGERYFVINGRCTKCGGYLGLDPPRGMYALCHNSDCLWHMKTGVCKFDRSASMPTYKGTVEEDGLYINI